MQLFDRDYEVEDPCQDHGMWTLRQSFRPNWLSYLAYHLGKRIQKEHKHHLIGALV